MQQGLTMQELRGESLLQVSDTETISASPHQQSSTRPNLGADWESKRPSKETEIIARVRPVASAACAGILFLTCARGPLTSLVPTIDLSLVTSGIFNVIKVCHPQKY
jgi:hypothetical protein